MGRKSIVRQVSDRLHQFAAYGQSKHADKLVNGGKPALDKIYSFQTMNNYMSASVAFAKWARSEHGCKTLDEAEKFTGEYLQQRMDRGLSAWTIRRDAAALGKLFQKPNTELGVQLPDRHRADVTQHRRNTSEGHFSERKHQDLVDFCRATGLRRHEVAQLRPEDVQRTSDGRAIVNVRCGKGGKARTVAALDAERVSQIATAAAAAGSDKVFEHIPKYAPIHEYRAQFAKGLYAQLARDVATLPRRERYDCRKDMKGVRFDRAAMGAVSSALGHNRLDVVTTYLK